MKKAAPKPKYKRATIETDGVWFYIGTPKYTSQCSTLWSACRAAVRAHREWIDKQPGGRFDNGVKITLPNGQWRMGYLWYGKEGVILHPVQGKAK